MRRHHGDRMNTYVCRLTFRVESGALRNEVMTIKALTFEKAITESIVSLKRLKRRHIAIVHVSAQKV